MYLGIEIGGTKLQLGVGDGSGGEFAAMVRHGAGRGAKIVLYVTVGTGIGGGLVVNGHLHGRSRPASSEIGHLRPGLNADRAEMTVESLAAGPAIAAAALARMTGQISTPL